MYLTSLRQVSLTLQIEAQLCREARAHKLEMHGPGPKTNVF